VLSRKTGVISLSHFKRDEVQPWRQQYATEGTKDVFIVQKVKIKTQDLFYPISRGLSTHQQKLLLLLSRGK
jgi:hypothetical protein